METSASELAALIGAQIEGDPNTRVTGVGSIDDARLGNVVLAGDKKFFKGAMMCDAACVVADHESRNNGNGHKTLLLTPQPAEAFAKILDTSEEPNQPRPSESEPEQSSSEALSWART